MRCRKPISYLAIASNVLAAVTLALYVSSHVVGHPHDLPFMVLSAIVFGICACLALATAVATLIRFSLRSTAERILGLEPLVVSAAMLPLFRGLW